MAETQANAPLEGNMLFYRRPEPLSIEQHGKLGLKHVDQPWGFAAKSHFVPLTVGEFSLAALHYPIIFAGEAQTPLAVMGLRDGENLFIGADGAINNEIYIPAYIRRYPFVVAADDESNRMIVCIDRESDLVVENADSPFFVNGEASEYTKGCIDFCQNFDMQRQTTESFIQLLKDNDLLDLRSAVYNTAQNGQPTGEAKVIAEYFAIPEEKLKALKPAVLAELRDSGALQQIYAHMISLGNWDRLINRAVARNPQALDGFMSIPAQTN